jgi:hypothetical protein
MSRIFLTEKITGVICEEPYTLPYYIGKGLREVDFKYPVDPLAGAFVKMGFADDRVAKSISTGSALSPGMS